jgi:monoterpene epsilon-lactone hydrolase
MVMSDRPEVRTASWPIAALDVVGLAAGLTVGLGRIPFRSPWRGPGKLPRNLAVSATRELVRSLLGYASSLPIDEFRALERILDGMAGLILTPLVTLQGVVTTPDRIAGVPGVWFRSHASVCSGTMVYLHGGGYIGTSPRMYALFMAHLARVTQCEIFVADYRLAPEFPFPAAAEDIVSIVRQLLAGGLPPERLIIAGDSGGGGLVGTVLHRIARESTGRPAAVLLFSPEVSLTLSEASVTDNAPFDVLPWNIPVNSYLHGVDPRDDRVDVLLDDPSRWPPTFLVYGGDEMFRDAIRALSKRLHDAGVFQEALEVDGMFHVFPFLLPWARESLDAYHRAGKFVQRALADDDVKSIDCPETKPTSGRAASATQ